MENSGPDGGYRPTLGDMATRRLSITVSEDLAAVISDGATRDGVTVSTWLADAARRRGEEQDALVDGYAAALDLLAEAGPVAREVTQRVDRVLAECGIVPANRAAG